MASFAFRLFIAKLPSYFGMHKVALDRLTDMLLISKEIREYYASQNNEKADQFWTKREQMILHALINCALTVIFFKFFQLKVENRSSNYGHTFLFGNLFSNFYGNF